MDRIEPAIFTRQKRLKKLIKLIEGKDSVPVDLKDDVETRILQLSQELGTSDLNKLRKEHFELTNRIKTKTELLKSSPIERHHLSSWYLRPLISHFDSPKKVKALKSENEGFEGLKDKIDLYLPPEIWSNDNIEILSNLNFYFQFKSMGKSKSRNLETAFYKLFKITDKNPFLCTSIGKNCLPVFYYNLEEFIYNLEKNENTTIVTGLCPMSGISNELRFVSRSGEFWQPELGFEPLPLPHEGFELAEIIFPPRPILSDYISLKTFIEILNHFTQEHPNANMTGLIWYPHIEYMMDYTEVVFSNWLETGTISKRQIIEEFNKIETRYKKLVEVVKECEGYQGKLNIHSTRQEDMNEFNRIVQETDIDRIKHIYGIWSGPESRLRLYFYLIIKHILPSLTGNNTMHLETSYELWPNVQGAKLVEGNNNAGTYSWICYPSTPSLSMSYMRDYNAPFEDKLYLGGPSEVIEQDLQELTKNYIAYVSPQIFNLNNLTAGSHSELRSLFVEKVLEINNALGD
jgi:hypothetical protein